MTKTDSGLNSVDAEPYQDNFKVNAGGNENDTTTGGYSDDITEQQNTVEGDDSRNINKSTSPPIGAQAFNPSSDYVDINHSDNDDHDGNFNMEDEFNIEDDRFTREKPVWNDVPFAIGFLFVFLGFVIMSMVMIIKHLDEYASDVPLGAPLPNASFYSFGTTLLIIFVSLVAFAVSMLIFIMAGRNSTKFVNFGLISVGVILALGAAGSFFLGDFMNLIIMAVMASLVALIKIKYEPLISLAATILSVVINVFKKYPSTLVAAFVGFLSRVIFTGILSLAVSCAYVAYGFHSDGSPKFDDEGNITSQLTFGLVCAIVFLNFTGLYIIDVTRNVMHVTIGGVYGTWYYMESTFEGMPRKEGAGSFKRAMTYSFGSVCLGSLFVVSFQSIAVYFSIHSGGFFGTIGNLSTNGLGVAVSYFNLYAYSYVALYGVDMVNSAKSTLSFVKQRGVQAFLNDSIISLSMACYCVVGSFASGIFAALYIALFKTIFGLGDNSTAALVGYAMVLTFYVTSIMMVTVISGSSVFFFALNKDPAVFEESHPFEFQEISRCYPKVLTKLQLNK